MIRKENAPSSGRGDCEADTRNSTAINPISQSRSSQFKAARARALLSRLDKVKRTGAGRYQARCPAHDDRGPSLSIRELDDGRVLVHCFAGCDVYSVLASVGLEIGALFPEREIKHGRSERRPFPAVDVLRCITFEALVVAIAGECLLSGEPFTEGDQVRLALAVSRIQAALNAAGVGHE